MRQLRHQRVQLLLHQGEEGLPGSDKGHLHRHGARRHDRAQQGRQGRGQQHRQGLQERVLPGNRRNDVLPDEEVVAGEVQVPRLADTGADDRPQLRFGAQAPLGLRVLVMRLRDGAVHLRERDLDVQERQQRGGEHLLQELVHGVEGGVRGVDGGQLHLGPQREDQVGAPVQDGQEVVEDDPEVHGRQPPQEGHHHVGPAEDLPPERHEQDVEDEVLLLHRPLLHVDEEELRARGHDADPHGGQGAPGGEREDDGGPVRQQNHALVQRLVLLQGDIVPVRVAEQPADHEAVAEGHGYRGGGQGQGGHMLPIRRHQAHQEEDLHVQDQGASLVGGHVRDPLLHNQQPVEAEQQVERDPEGHLRVTKRQRGRIQVGPDQRDNQHPLLLDLAHAGFQEDVGGVLSEPHQQQDRDHVERRGHGLRH
uniref:Uncharacterized protein n=1 Tax=Schistocephalus solidus bunya-like virus TaxID=2729338 RepID=A0A6M3RSD5_9VIRU|nr:hypothetical protein [Schistocephalus solidus bunya-like virus]